MIAAIEWIPAGRADPAPTKYEYSRAEREFMARVWAGNLGEEGDDGADADTKKNGEGNADGDESRGSDEEWEDIDDGGGEEGGEGGSVDEVKLPVVDPASLPADLRMDEYSDGEDGDDKGKDVGMLLGQDAGMTTGGALTKPKGGADNDQIGDDDDEHDSEDEDDLADVPDTREYMPLDLEGLQSLSIGGGKIPLDAEGLRSLNLGGGGKIVGMPGGDEGYTVEDLKNMIMNSGGLLDEDEDDKDDAEDIEDIKIRDSDALVVVAKTEGDFASLEVNVFDTGSCNLYVHHDIPLPSFPLCLALGSVVSSSQPNENGDAATGNYVAVGSFEPGIEIWNLDVMNALEPTLVLGGMDTGGAEEDWMRMQVSSKVGTNVGGGKKIKKKKAGAAIGRGLREGSHVDAVMGLSWNAIHRQVLASGSADGTVKLWDVTQSTRDYVRPSATLTHHADKVQSLAWHPSEGTLLATGGYDRNICLVDARSAAAGQINNVKRAKLSADCEALVWDPHDLHYLTAASEDGVIRCWDVRRFSGSGDCKPVWSFVAHEYGGVSDICYNSQVPGMLITCSIDKTVALWDTLNSASLNPQPCGSKDMNAGKLYSASCYPSSPWLLVCGGSGNELAIWDMEGEETIRRRFAGRIPGCNVVAANDNGQEPDFEAVMASGDSDATEKALWNMSKSRKKKGRKKNKAHKRK